MSEHGGSTTLIGFGDPEDSTTFAFFHVESDERSGVYPDWEQDIITSNHHIPGSNRTDTFISGFDVATLTLTVWFDDREAFIKARALYGSTDTLRILAVFTSQGGPVTHILDNDYEDFDNTTLIRIGRVLHTVDGHVEAELVFQRGFDPVTGTGVA